MVKVTLLVIGVLGIVAAAALPASAQCVTFSPTVACAPRRAAQQQKMDVAVGEWPDMITQLKAGPVPALPARDAKAVDCRMVRPVDEQFSSAMPVKRPDPAVRYAAKVVAVPTCQP